MRLFCHKNNLCWKVPVKCQVVESSDLTNRKTKKGERLNIVVEEMRVALSNVPPDIKGICAESQAQISH